MKWIIGIAIAIFILMVATFSILMSTPTGFNMGLRLAKNLIPGKFNYSTVSGAPKGAITVVKFNYCYHGLKISVDKLNLNWNPIALLAGTLYITHLDAKNIKIISSPSLKRKNKKEKINLPSQWQLPLSLEIEEGYLKNINIDRKTEAYHPVLVKSLRFKKVNLNYSLSATIDAEIVKPFITNLHLLSTGTRDNYYFFLTIKNPNLHWRIDGKGTRQWVELKMHEAHTLDGYLNACMKINFKPVLQWRINTDIAHLNLRHLCKNWPKKLTFQLNTIGRYKEGQFFNFTLSGLLQTPKAYFHIIGQHEKVWDLNWSVDVDDFSSLLAAMSGTLKGCGSITGPIQSPLIRGDLIGKNIKLPNYYAAEINGHWCLDISFNQASSAKFNFHQLTTPFLQFSRLKINASGDPHTHQISADTLINGKKSGKIVINLLLHENSENKIWYGTFTRFNIYSRKLGKWNINQPVTVVIASNHTTLFPLCLHSHNDYLCLRSEWGKRSFFIIDGKITINSTDLALLRTILPDPMKHRRLKYNFHISRSLKKPALTDTIDNTLELKQDNVKFSVVKAALIKIHASVNVTSSRINYRFDAYSQNQSIQIIGQTQLSLPGHPTTFTLRGDNILLMNTHQYIIYGTVNLKIDIKGRDINITGTLRIPKAILKPATFSRSTTITQDVVYVGPEVQKHSLWRTHMNVKIMLGNQIFLDSLGIKGRFTGELTLLKIPPQPLIANGRIIIINGTFITHGHTLDITPHSSVSFIRSPINNPFLNVRAIRTLRSLSITPQIGNQIMAVGLDIGGTLHHPEVRLYASDPNLTQADISSYLIFGHPANDVNTPNNVNLLMNAIDTFNIVGDQTSMRGIFNQITKGLGLTELGIESQITTVLALDVPTTISHIQSAFVIGRYLSSHIYIRYSRGITIPINIIQLRYLISKNWAIQTEASSEGSGGDVLYTI